MMCAQNHRKLGVRRLFLLPHLNDFVLASRQAICLCQMGMNHQFRAMNFS